MNPSTLLSLLFTYTLICISQVALAPSPAPSPSGSPKLYEIVCNETGNATGHHEYVNRCLTLLETNIPQIASANNYPELCRLILRMGIDKGTKAQNYIKGLVAQYPSSEAIKGCANHDYTEFVSLFQSALMEIVEDPGTVSYDAKVASDGPFYCQQNLNDEKIVNPSINQLNFEMDFISTVASIAANHLDFD